MEHVERVLDLPDKGDEPFSELKMVAPSGDPNRPFRYSIKVNTNVMASLSFSGEFEKLWKEVEKLVLEDIKKNPLGEQEN